MMNSIERFYATIERRPVDRPASWLGIPEKHAVPALLNYFNVSDIAQLKRKIGDDGSVNPGFLAFHTEIFNSILHHRVKITH